MDEGRESARTITTKQRATQTSNRNTMPFVGQRTVARVNQLGKQAVLQAVHEAQVAGALLVDKLGIHCSRHNALCVVHALQHGLKELHQLWYVLRHIFAQGLGDQCQALVQRKEKESLRDGG